MPPRRPGRLFLRMALTLGGALALAFAVAASLSIWIGTRALGRSVDQELSGIAHLVHLDVERFLKERRGDLQLCAEVEAMDDVVLGDVRFRIENQLIHLSRSYPGIYDELAVMDPNGEVVAATRGDRIGTRLPVQLMRLLDRGDGSLVGPGPQRVPGAPDPVLVMAQEIRSSVSHQPAGWLVALVRWSAVSNVVQSTSVEGRSQSREAFLILYQDDQPIAGHAEWRPGAFANDRRQLIHSRVLAHEDPRHYTGAETFVELAAGVSAAGWRVVFYRDAAEAFAPVRLFAWSVLAAGILGLLLAAALTLRAAGEFTRRVEVLRQGTQRLASGDYAHRVSDVRGDELAQLGESYNQMAEAMQAARARIEQSHAELEDSNRRLLEASRLKDEFLANTSHELRTPLNGILGFLGLVTDGLCDSPAEERDSVRLALECGHTLRLLIEDVLDVSYIEAGRLSLAMQNVAVAPAVERALAEMAPRARARGLELTGMPLADPALAVRADPQRLQQERRPLLDHAIKVTEGGSVTVACTAHEAAGHVCLEVRDTGIGIARDRQARVFERFVQGVGSATRKFGGTGLGHGGLHGARGRRPRVPRGPRHRDRHRARPPGARLRALRPGRRERDAQVRRHRARPLARARSGGDDGRRGPARERRRRLRHHRDRLAPGGLVRRRGPRSRRAVAGDGRARGGARRGAGRADRRRRSRDPHPAPERASRGRHAHRRRGLRGARLDDAPADAPVAPRARPRAAVRAQRPLPHRRPARPAHGREPLDGGAADPAPERPRSRGARGRRGAAEGGALPGQAGARRGAPGRRVGDDPAARAARRARPARPPRPQAPGVRGLGGPDRVAPHLARAKRRELSRGARAPAAGVRRRIARGAGVARGGHDAAPAVRRARGHAAAPRDRGARDARGSERLAAAPRRPDARAHLQARRARAPGRALPAAPRAGQPGIAPRFGHARRVARRLHAARAGGRARHDAATTPLCARRDRKST